MDWNPPAMTDARLSAEAAAIGHAGAVITIDLAAIRANYSLLKSRLGRTTCAAVVKADGYGLGAALVARTLAGEGCRTFFVAHLSEAIALRPAVPDAEIIVLHGPTPGAEPLFQANAIIPVLNSLEQVAGYRAFAAAMSATLPALLQLDSGMSRFGLTEDELEALLDDGDAFTGIDLRFVMSHLACADDAAHPANAAQLACFRRMLLRFPGVPASLAASSGIFLGPDYHFDLVRPGAALYGVAPQGGVANPLSPVVQLHGRVMQTRQVPVGAGVGYGHTEVAERPMRLATVAVGYADGFLRSGSSRAQAWLNGKRLAVVGRVSMDSIILDVTDFPGEIGVGTLVELIGEHHDIDAAARAAGTIGYELLTSLGSRYARCVIGG